MVDKEDVILSQITSNPYTDIQAIELSDTDFSKGSLQRISFVRPGKLFTAHSSLIVSHVGNLKKEKFNFIIDEIVKIFRRNN